MNARQIMTREEALRLVVLSVRGANGPDVSGGDLGLEPRTVSRIIQTIPLGCCPRWVVQKPRNPRTSQLECTVAEVRQLAGLILGERERVLSESILEYLDAVDGGERSLFPPEITEEKRCASGHPETGTETGQGR